MTDRRRLTLYMGAVGTGKTTLLRQHVRYYRDVLRRQTLILDVEGQWRDVGGETPDFEAGEDEDDWLRRRVLSGEFRGGLLVLDDADSYLDGAALGKRSPWRRLFTTFRHVGKSVGGSGLDVAVVTRRVQEVPKIVSMAASTIFIFALAEPLAVERVRSSWGDKAARMIPTRDYEFLRIDVRPRPDVPMRLTRGKACRTEP